MTDAIPCRSCREMPGWITDWKNHTVIFCGNDDCPDERLVMADTAEEAIRRWNEENAP